MTVTVAPVNDAPVSYNDTYTTLEDVPLIVLPAGGILTNDVDVDRDVLTALTRDQRHSRQLEPQHQRGFTYTPNTNYNGSDSFAYRAARRFDHWQRRDCHHQHHARQRPRPSPSTTAIACWKTET